MKKQANQGFTLIELLVASGVTAIIVGLMITMVSNLLTAYNRSSGALSAQSQAGFVLDQMATELESLVVRNTGDVMFAATINSDLGGFDWADSAKPDGASLAIPTVAPADVAEPLEPIEQYRFGKEGSWVRFITSAPSLTADSDSGVRAVGYRIGFDGVTNADDAPKQYMLFRSEVLARETFDAGYNLDPTTGDYVDDEKLESHLKDTPEDDIIAGNVIDFGVRLFGVNSDKERELLFPLGTTPTEYLASGNGVEEYPRSVEVFIRILTPEGERLLSAVRAGNFTGDWWEIAIQNSAVFSRVINIPSRPI
tara:strand:- start:2556 stop:3485 length:930 start_codon:yes stop_codon:yes gene_type:complete